MQHLRVGGAEAVSRSPLPARPRQPRAIHSPRQLAGIASAKQRRRAGRRARRAMPEQQTRPWRSRRRGGVRAQLCLAAAPPRSASQVRRAATQPNARPLAAPAAASVRSFEAALNSITGMRLLLAFRQRLFLARKRTIKLSQAWTLAAAEVPGAERQPQLEADVTRSLDERSTSNDLLSNSPNYLGIDQAKPIN
ncbi:hypothetical protein FG95_00315 [Sphingopyxis sp. LC363]|nr:hypothetical protein FG95_00315 [Sphingopyxis sp. LC363]